MSTQIYSADGADTWTCPTGVTSVTVECWGGGGGADSAGGLAGGGGGFAGGVINVTPTTIYNVYVGAGGAADTNGEDSTWESSVIIARGGKRNGGGGISPSNIGTTVYNGGSGDNSGGGGGGSAFATSVGGDAVGNTGGIGEGNGGDGGVGATPGQAPGGGGGYVGQSGATGQIILTWNASGVGGDPHFLGFDGEYFDFHKRGFYTLFQDCIVTVNANLVAMGHQTFISEVGIIFGKHKIKITNKDHIRLPLFGEHKINLTTEQRNRITSKEFRQLRHFSEGRKYLPGAMSFLSGDITDAYVMPLPHGSVLVSRMLQEDNEFLNITFNIVPGDSTGIVGQTIGKNRLSNEHFKVNSLFEKWNKSKVVP